MKSLLACAILAVSAVSAVAAAAPLELVTENNPPYNFADGKEVKGTATAAVREMLAKAGLQANITVLKWDDAYKKAQASANTCIYSTARVENRERLFKWFGPVATNTWALYAAPGFNKPVPTTRDARFFKIGALKGDAKVDFMRDEGASSIREAEKDSDNAVRLMLPKTDPLAIDLWVTSHATAKEMAAAVGVKNLKEVLVVRKQDLYLACNPRTDKAALEKLAAASKTK